MAADTWQDIITDALSELGVYAPSDPVSAVDMDTAARICDRLIDGWAALKRYAYNVAFPVYTLTAGHTPHLIGPGLSSPDFAATVRPVRLEGAALIVNGVDIPINVRDDDWWQERRVKAVTSSVPTDVYYSSDFPNGALYFWPVPSSSYQVRIETWVELGAIPLDADGNRDLTQAFVGPQGYRDALVLTLAEKCARVFGKSVSGDLRMDAATARAAVQSNNAKSPRIASADIGTGGGGRGGFNYMTGGPA
jgi:hypothetical protein